MDPRFLLDTNVISETSMLEPNPHVMRAFERHEASCVLPAPVLEELQFGVARLAMGRERARLTRMGTPTPRTDGEIAAIAVTRGLSLVTRNQADFAAFDGLQLANWHDP